MKNILFIALIFSSFSSIAQQTDKGQWVIGAESDLSLFISTIENSENFTAFQIGGRGGYFVKDNLATAVLLNYSYNGNSNLSTNSIAIGPGVRYYIDGRYFVGASYQYLYVNSQAGNSESSDSFGRVGAEVGYAFFVGEKVALEPAFNFTTVTGDGSSTSNFGIRLGFSLYF